MNHRKRKQAENQKRKVYTPEGYILDPPDSICPHCGKKQKPCSYVNSLSRAWARSTCSKKNPILS